MVILPLKFTKPTFVKCTTICQLHKGLQTLKPILSEGKLGIHVFSRVVHNVIVWTLHMLFSKA